MKSHDPIRVRLRRYFVSGLIIFLPVALTVYFLSLFITIVDGFLGKFIKPYFLKEFGFYYRGISIIIGSMVIFLIGFFATNFLGRKIYRGLENLLRRLPFAKQVYPAIKEMALFVFSRDHLNFQQVVFVEYPRKGIYSPGFLTNDAMKKMSDKIGKELVNVFMPSVPNPLTGYVILVPKEEIIFADISVEEALKLMVSGGVVNPE